MKIDKTKLFLAMANKAFSTRELVKQSGVSEVTLAKLKKGECEARPETIGKIAKALDVSPEDIVQTTS